MTVKKPSQEEEEYFAKEEATRRIALAAEKKRALDREEQSRLKQLHFMKCPKDGMDLETVTFKGLKIDKCFHCNGTWLDAGELEQLAGKESDVLHKIIALFKHS